VSAAKIVAGFGFRASATVDSLRSAYDIAAADHTVTALATSYDKAQATCLTLLADALALPIHPIGAGAIAGAQTITQSPRIQRERSTGSLAEATALAAAGPGARLISSRHISQDRRATCAIAIGEQT